MEQIILSPIPFDQLTRIIKDAVRTELQAHPPAYAAQPVAFPQQYLTRRETAGRLGISLVTLNEWTKTGQIPGFRIGTRVRYKSDEVDAALKAIITTKNR